MTPDKPTLQFIRQHREEDIHHLALKFAASTDIDLPLALQQIEGWQKARRKLPSWAACEGLLYPPPLSMEQCSSEVTALYKAEICRRITDQSPKPTLLTDLTGGYGVDFAFMARVFDRTTYIERQPVLCAAARHNFGVLGLVAVAIKEGDSMELLDTLPPQTLIYADPARRDLQGRRTFGIADCTPDLLAHRHQWLNKARHTLIKLSPMLDWHKAVSDLNEGLDSPVVSEVHIVATGNECKELLLLVTPQNGSESPTVTCVNDGQLFSYDPQEETAPPRYAEPEEGGLLYEPNAAIMKAGCFEQLSHRYDMPQIGPNSHLLVATRPQNGFPGREFTIDHITSLNKKALQPVLQRIKKANIAVRNFPLSAPELRKRLRIAEGGDVYLFGTTTAGGEHRLLFCTKRG